MTETTETQVKTTFDVPEENFQGLEEGIARLNRRAKRLGVPAIVMTVLGHEDREIMRHVLDKQGFKTGRMEGTGEFRRYFQVEILGEKPRLNGYTFVATLEYLEGEVLLRTSRSFEGQVPVRFRSSNPETCDHCKATRRRSQTFVVRKDDSEEFFQIGRQCLKDFLGYHHDPKSLASMAEILFEASELGAGAEESFGGGGGLYRFGLPLFLSAVASVIRQDGWMSRSRAQALSMAATADVAWSFLTAKPGTEAERALAGYKPTDVDREMAEKALEWVRETIGTKVDRNDYEHNVYVATKGETVTHKTAGIVASVVAGYQREQGRLVEKRLETIGVKDSVHFGEVGQRLDFYATLYKIINIETMYGTSYLHKFRTREGNMVVWFASSRPVTGTAENGTYIHVEPSDKEYLVTGTVKKHDERDGIKQTAMTRLVLWSDEGRAAHEAKLAKKAAREAKKAAKAALEGK